MSDIKSRVKTCLRISHTKLDQEMEHVIEAARLELIRSGVSSEKARSEDPLIENAVIAYCMMQLGYEEQKEQYRESFLYQQDCLRRSRGYRKDE